MSRRRPLLAGCPEPVAVSFPLDAKGRSVKLPCKRRTEKSGRMVIPAGPHRPGAWDKRPEAWRPSSNQPTAPAPRPCYEVDFLFEGDDFVWYEWDI